VNVYAILGVAGGGIVAAATVAVLMFMMGRRAADAEKRGGDAREAEATKAGDLKVADATILAKDATIDAISQKATYWEGRFHALSAAFDEAVAGLPDDAHRARVLARASKATAAGGEATAPSSDPGRVPVEQPPPARSKDDDLLRPDE
jgi:hypothetical protein